MLPTRFLSYAFCTIFSHCAMSACSPMHCPGYVELIYGAWYHLIGETCSEIHCEVAPSFPAGVSQVCTVFIVILIFANLQGQQLFLFKSFSIQKLKTRKQISPEGRINVMTGRNAKSLHPNIRLCCKNDFFHIKTPYKRTKTNSS